MTDSNNPNSPEVDGTSSKPTSSAAKSAIRIGSQRDLADKSLSPQHPQAVRRAAGRLEDSSDDEGLASASEKDVIESAPVRAEVADAAIPPIAPPAPSKIPEPAKNEPTYDAPAEPEMSLDEEIEAALGGMSIEQLMNESAEVAATELEPDSRLQATVARIHGDDVFLKLSGRFEGVTSLRHLAKPPNLGEVLEVIVKRYNDEEGLYEVSAPGASIDVSGWSDLTQGTIVEARVTGINTGGLECSVNNIRGFIPASQVALYRVEQFNDFVNQKFACVVTEADPERKRLVLSRRAVLEREQAAKREELLKSLQPGQTMMGVVTKLMDFGAFVDIGGMEGLVHVSKLSWDRVTHPSEVLKVGEKIKVKVEKIAEGSGKLSLSYRDTLQDPWENIEQKYPANSTARGTVSRIAQFGAFVKLEPGVEGLVHISELAHHRVFAVKNVVKEGDEVEVKVLSIDREAQRMSLSLKATQAKPEPKIAAGSAGDEPDIPPRQPAVAPRHETLKGGRDRKSGGEDVGLHW